MNNQTTSGDTAALLYSLSEKGREGGREGGEGEGGRGRVHMSAKIKSLQVLYLIFASSCHTLLHLGIKENMNNYVKILRVF